jgi:hypothetical protein
MSKPRLLISTDVETLGTVAGLHPLLSIGAAAIQMDRTVISTFEVNLQPALGLVPDPETLKWWQDPSRAEAWARSTLNPQPCYDAMKWFKAWVTAFQEKFEIEFLAKPSTFDMPFIQYYLHRYTGGSPFEKARGWDLYTIISIITGIPVTTVKIENLPESYWKDLKDTCGIVHTGIGDGIYQGLVAVRCLNDLENITAEKTRWAA